MTPLGNAMHATEVIGRVAERLGRAGGVIELGQLERMSVQELEVLVRRERGLS